MTTHKYPEGFEKEFTEFKIELEKFIYDVRCITWSAQQVRAISAAILATSHELLERMPDKLIPEAILMMEANLKALTKMIDNFKETHHKSLKYLQ